jgi:hypothetical protein
MLGEEVLVHVATSEHRYITNIHPHEAAGLKNERIRLTPVLNPAHIFDAEICRNLTLSKASTFSLQKGC